MDHSNSNENEHEVLIRLARQHFLQSLCSSIPELDRLVVKRFEMAGDSNFQELEGGALPITTWFQDYMQHRRSWAQKLLAIWRAALVEDVNASKTQTLAAATSIEELSLVSDDVIEGMIASSRISMNVAEKVEPSFAELRKRLLALQQSTLRSKDAFQPLVVAENLVEAWTEARLQKRAFMWVMQGIAKDWAAILLNAYQTSNDFLEEKGIKPLKVQPASAARTAENPMFSHPSSAMPSYMSAGHQEAQIAASAAAISGMAGAQHPNSPTHTLAGAYPIGAAGIPGGMVSATGSPAHAAAPGFLAPQMLIPGTVAPVAHHVEAAALVAPVAQFGQPAIQQTSALWNGIQARLVQVIGPAPSADTSITSLAPSPALVEAMGEQQIYVQKLAQAASPSALMKAPAQVSQEVAQLAREQSEALKEEADKPNEKAIIEMVALMFQSVISEGRVPASVRVLFARLQVPVLRIALSEPTFFTDQAHPVRRLIDRMGSAAMGFDGANFQGSALEVELSRIVQMIEQYPDTGSKVFQLALNEFEKFLQKFLAENRQAGQAMSVAQQVEEKETLLVKFTIELRKMLQDVPIKDELRAFLFKTWAEVLAVSAVRSGAQSTETKKFKQTAALLVWAVGSKTDVVTRKRVIQALPGLLARLRHGLSMIGVTEVAQEAIQNQITQSIQTAFISQAEGLSLAKIKQLSTRLEGLEKLVSQEDVEDIALSPENIEMMTGLELAGLVVIEEPANTGVSAEVLQWARNRSVGEWFYLIPGGGKNTSPTHTTNSKQGTRVQYAWHSAHRHLHLLLMPDGRSLLMKLKTLAVCFDQGQLIPVDQEGLMLRATRVALNQYQPLTHELANALERSEESVLTTLAADNAVTNVLTLPEGIDFATPSPAPHTKSQGSASLQ
ncbi:DUF1631 domain-containing protein [Lampropedia puyangensis]|uniref:DUF1631 domain-containing protein n=1 Tax=Lampropedia puyangensis TaxID=1330072 RepID=A0A4S8FAS1_9BURK|nr:DUF1631 family protein [Lampropedia puyangensis]THU04407.1 DUF1631 domain-containing protein [Lampropedia puyangensis]